MSLFRNLFSLAARTWIYPSPNADDEDFPPVPDEESRCNHYSAEPYQPSQHLDAETLQVAQSTSDDDSSSLGADGSLYSVFTGQQDMADEVLFRDTPTFADSSSQSSDQAPVALLADQAQPRAQLPPNTDDEPRAANQFFHSPQNQPLPASSVNQRRGRDAQHSSQQRELTTRASAFPLIDLVSEENEPISRREARRRRAQERKAAQNGTSSQPHPEADEPEQDPQLAPSTSQNGSSVERISPEERAIRIYTARYGVASLANPASSSTTHPRPRRSHPTPSAPSSSAHVHTPIAGPWPALPISERYHQIGRAAGPSGLMPAFNNPLHSPGDRHNDIARERLTRYLQPQTQIYRHIPSSHQVSNTPATLQSRWQLGPPSRSEEFNNDNSPCLICFDIPRNFPRFRPTSRCTHKSTICASCLEQHISFAVRTRGLTTLTCPDTGCRQVMEYADVLRGAKNDRACLDRYETLLLRRTLEKEPNFIWCKNPTCNWGQVHESGAAAPIVICQGCRARSCFTHDVPWHTGLTCEQYTIARRAEMERQDHASQTYIEQHAKRCPGPSCGRLIEKTDGCDHMTCLPPVGCGHEFCWVCLADYEPIRREGNHRHRDTCPYHAPSRSITPAFIITPFEGEVEVAQLVEAERLERLMHWEDRFGHLYDDDDPDRFH